MLPSSLHPRALPFFFLPKAQSGSRGCCEESSSNPRGPVHPGGRECVSPSTLMGNWASRGRNKPSWDIVSSHPGRDLCSCTQGCAGVLVSAQPSAFAIWLGILFSSVLVYVGQFWSLAPSNKSSYWPWRFHFTFLLASLGIGGVHGEFTLPETEWLSISACLHC